MAKCRQCGQPILFETALCPYCQRKRAAERQREADNQKVRPNPAGAGCLEALARPLLKLLKIFGVFLIFSAVIWVILFFVFDVYKIDYAVVGESTRTAEKFESFLLSMDDNRSIWEIRYEKKNAGVFSRVAFWNQHSCTIRYNKGTNVSHTTFIFEGENLGTGLPDGTYILTKINWEDVLIDKNNKLIYKADSAFYQTNAPKLQAFLHDALLGKLFEQMKDGEHGLVETNPPTEAIFTENAAMIAELVRNNPNVLRNQGFEARCNIGGDVWEVYQFTYPSGSAQDPRTDGYTYAE